MLEDDYVAGNPQLNGTDRLVVVFGCSGGGKSALLAEMARRGYQVNPEPGRQIVKEQTFIGGDGLPWANVPRFVELCVARATYFYNAALPSDKAALFDRSIVDAISYLARQGFPTPPYLRNALQRYRYARVVFLTPPLGGAVQERPRAQHAFSDAVAEYEDLLESYPASGYEVEVILKAGVCERADFLEDRLDRLPSEA